MSIFASPGLAGSPSARATRETSEAPALPPSSIEALVTSPSRDATRLDMHIRAAPAPIDASSGSRPRAIRTDRRRCAGCRRWRQKARNRRGRPALSLKLLDAALAVERERAPRRQSRAARRRACRAGSAKRASSLPAGMLGSSSSPTRKVTRMSSSRKLAEQALTGIGRVVGAGGRQPRLPQRPLADHLAQIEPVAVEIELDQRGARRLAGASRRGTWCRSARPRHRQA